MAALRVGMIFGGRSVEHEISVLTAQQALAALPRDAYTPIPIYISKSGAWFTGDALLELDNYKDLEALERLAEPVVFSADATRPGLLARRERRGLLGRRTEEEALTLLDVAFPLIHGSHGEDGTLQGLLELADLPYVGSGVAASALGMDKALARVVLRAAGVPVLDDLTLARRAWREDPEGALARIEERFGYPVFVKPARLGSSIGVARAEDRAGLRFGLEVAAAYDSRLVIEPELRDSIEINCAVLWRGGQAQPSVCEQPLKGALLSYEDKYLTGDRGKGMKGARRLIPAPLDEALTKAIQAAAVAACAAIGAEGVARVDFLARPEAGEFVVNEINTLPGSLAFYLWEPAGVPFGELLRVLIEGALERGHEKGRSTYAFESSLLRGRALGGLKVGAAPRD